MVRFAAIAVLMASPAYAETIYFQSPSGNIHCAISDDPNFDGARCDILEVNNLSFPRRPDWCQDDYGRAFYVPSVGAAEPICHTDTVAGNEPVLGYGQRIVLGNVACYSETTGMECQNGQGRGFALRRAQQVVY